MAALHIRRCSGHSRPVGQSERGSRGPVTVASDIDGEDAVGVLFGVLQAGSGPAVLAGRQRAAGSGPGAVVVLPLDAVGGDGGAAVVAGRGPV